MASHNDTLRRVSAFLSALLLAAAPAGAAAVDASAGGGPATAPTSSAMRQIAVARLSSISDYTSAIDAGLKGIVPEAFCDDAIAALSWLVPLPSRSCVDVSRPIVICLLTSVHELEMPERVVILPLSPYGGEFSLRESLAATYGDISGSSVLYCSKPTVTNAPPELCMLIKDGSAVVAESREGLRWIVRKFRDGDLPSVHPVRSPCPVTVSFDGALLSDLLGQILPAGATASSSYGFVALLRDLLASLQSLDVSFSANSRRWHAAVRLNFAEQSVPVKAVPEVRGRLCSELPGHSFCRSVSALPSLIASLPMSFRERYGESSPYAPYCGFHILPGIPLVDKVLFPYLAGERAACYIVSSRTRTAGKVEVFHLTDPAAVADIVARTVSGAAAIPGAKIKPHAVRFSHGTMVVGYTTTLNTKGAIDRGEVDAVAISAATGLNNIETAVVGDLLVVAYGKLGVIDTWFAGRHAAHSSANLSEIIGSSQPPPEGETSLGGGEMNISATLKSALAVFPDLETIAARLPRSGGNVNWRITRCPTGAVVEMEATSMELIALQLIRQIDTSDLIKTMNSDALDMDWDPTR